MQNEPLSKFLLTLDGNTVYFDYFMIVLYVYYVAIFCCHMMLGSNVKC